MSSPVVSLSYDNPVDDETCLGCHDGYDRSLLYSPHRLGSQVITPSAAVNCTSCHQGGSVHAVDPAADNITNPAKLSDLAARQACQSCHTVHVEMDNYGFDPHTDLQLNCSNCHTVHQSGESLPRKGQAAFCLKCHTETKAGFADRSSHPLLSGNVTCLSCHSFSKRIDDDAAYDLDRICHDCHPEQAGPFPYEHAAVNAYSVEGGSCMECHRPHGSPNDRLLSQPISQLCRQCHMVPRHRLAHGGIYAGYDCRSCHIDVHGSYVSHNLLDPDLPARFGPDCYQSGCHSLNQ
ncbi:MAG: hypothetical protein OEW00_01435 [candidate division Zixibacteria bacterium]|nr:hypothetical protein [candidate division Zixibacteria bacterium]